MTSLDLPSSASNTDADQSKGIIGAVAGAVAATILHYFATRAMPWSYGISATLIGIGSGLVALKMAGCRVRSNGIAVTASSIALVLLCEFMIYRTTAVALPPRYRFDEWIKPPQRVYFDADEQYLQALKKHRELTALPESEQRRRHAERIAVLHQVNRTNTSFGQYARTHAGRFRMTMLFAALGIWLGYRLSARAPARD